MKRLATWAVVLAWSAGAQVAHAAHAPEGGGPPVTPAAVPLFDSVPWLTNSFVYTWVVALIILAVIRLGTKHMKEIPTGLQNFIEMVVEGLEDMTKGLLEPKVVRWCFPLVATFFIFILTSNLMGLMPGVGSMGWGHPKEGSILPFALEHADVPLFRPPTADANMTLGMSIVFFVMSTWWALKYNGGLGLLNHIFGVKGGMKGPVVIPLFFIFLFIGLIEVVSILIRPVALSMRLYGNIYGGENVLTLMLAKAPFGLAAIPFYFLEMVVAAVQALVFTVLAIAFIGTLCSHLEDEGHGAH